MAINYTKIGVIGAGVMGTGVAHTAALRGLRVVLVDKSEDKLSDSHDAIGRELKAGALFGQKPNASPDEIVNRIKFSRDLRDVGEVDYVVENIVEVSAEKRELYRQLSGICSDGCVIAANTSAIPITQIASNYRRPSQVIGIHFMNPVPKKTHVEVIPGLHTTEETITRTTAFLSQIGKVGIMVKDSPGFVSNRVLMLTVNEAINLVREQVATAADVDAVFKHCFGHKMGPLETADLIGLDTILLSLEVLFENFREPKYCPSPLLRQLVDAGRLGRKSGSGFFNYS